MNNKFLETKNITKTFGKLKALDDVNFNLYRGKIHGLLGENGAGKSSLMNLITGVIKPNYGDIIINNEDSTQYPIYVRTKSEYAYYQTITITKLLNKKD